MICTTAFGVPAFRTLLYCTPCTALVCISVHASSQFTSLQQHDILFEDKLMIR